MEPIARSVLRRAALRLAPVTLAGCVSMEGTVRDSASVDFNCPTYQITIDPMSGDRYMASGCGVSSTYQCTPAAPGGGLHNPTCTRAVPDATSR